MKTVIAYLHRGELEVAADWLWNFAAATGSVLLPFAVIAMV